MAATLCAVVWVQPHTTAGGMEQLNRTNTKRCNAHGIVALPSATRTHTSDPPPPPPPPPSSLQRGWHSKSVVAQQHTMVLSSYRTQSRDTTHAAVFNKLWASSGSASSRSTSRHDTQSDVVVLYKGTKQHTHTHSVRWETEQHVHACTHTQNGNVQPAHHTFALAFAW